MLHFWDSISFTSVCRVVVIVIVHCHRRRPPPHLTTPHLTPPHLFNVGRVRLKIECCQLNEFNEGEGR